MSGSKSPTKVPPRSSVPKKSASPNPKKSIKDSSEVRNETSELIENLDDSKILKQLLVEKTDLKQFFLGKYEESTTKKKVSIEDTIWDYAIVLQNPDFNDEGQKAISIDQAKKFFKTCFKPKKYLNPHQQTLAFANQASAFVEAFKDLDDYEDGKKFKNGGRIKKIGENDFLRQKGPCKDFLSLIQNSITVKLVSDLGLKVKSILSTTGEYIFLIISAEDEDLAQEAERIRYSKQLELSLTDMISLLPCDFAYRPFQILKFQDKEISQLYKPVKEIINKDLGLSKNNDKVDYKYDPVGLTPAHINTYKIYLKYLNEGIAKVNLESVTNHNHRMLLFKGVVEESIEKANKSVAKEFRLYNLWDRLGINKPFAPYAEYRRSSLSGQDELVNLWCTHQIDEFGQRSLFMNYERIRLLCSFIYTQINLNALVENEIILAHFPLHNNWLLTGRSTRFIRSISPDDEILKIAILSLNPKKLTESLIDSWETRLIRQQIPLDKIKNYYGEKIALYFEFLKYFQLHLLIPGVLGLGVFIVQRVLEQNNPAVLACNGFYCLFIIIWSTIFIEIWKRKESSQALVWGQTEFEKTDMPRPQFKGMLRRSPVTDDMEEIHYESTKRIKSYIISGFTTSLIILIVLAIVAGLLILKQSNTTIFIYNGVDYVSLVCSVANAIQIQIFNIIYAKLVKVLTDLENHKTQNDYEDSLVLKTFCFQFVNSFNSLVYIAFIKPQVTNNSKESCMNELYTQLISIFLVSYARNFIEIGLPYLKYKLNKCRKSKARVDNIKDQADLRYEIENQLCLQNYVNLEEDGTIDDYLELSIQFGYITLFSIAFPLSTALLFVGLWLEMLTDKLKILKLVRRPLPLATKDIGTWKNIFSLICALSVLSNTALFCFTAPTFSNWKSANDNSYLIFVVIIAVLFIFRSQLMSWIPDVQYRYQVIKDRHDFIVEKYLRGSPIEKDTTDTELYDPVLYYCSQEL